MTLEEAVCGQGVFYSIMYADLCVTSILHPNIWSGALVGAEVIIHLVQKEKTREFGVPLRILLYRDVWFTVLSHTAVLLLSSCFIPDE